MRRGRTAAVAVYLAILAAVVCDNTPLLATDEQTQAFLQEAPVAWVSYLDQITELQAEIEVDTTWPPSGKRESGRFEVWSLVPYALTIDVEESGRELVQGVNPDYSFELTRRSAGSDWLLSELKSNDDATKQPTFFFPSRKQRLLIPPSAMELVATNLAAGLLVAGGWLPELIADPDFAVEEVRLVQGPPHRLVRVAYRYEPEVDYARIALRSGWLELLPDRYWLVHRAETSVVSPSDAGVLKTEYEYRVDERGVPLLVSQRRSASYRSTPEVQNYIMNLRYQITRMTDADTTRFRLSGYGLPEPDLGQHRTRRFWLFLALSLGLACVLFALMRGMKK